MSVPPFSASSGRDYPSIDPLIEDFERLDDELTLEMVDHFQEPALLVEKMTQIQSIFERMKGRNVPKIQDYEGRVAHFRNTLQKALDCCSDEDEGDINFDEGDEGDEGDEAHLEIESQRRHASELERALTGCRWQTENCYKFFKRDRDNPDYVKVVFSKSNHRNIAFIALKEQEVNVAEAYARHINSDPREKDLQAFLENHHAGKRDEILREMSTLQGEARLAPLSKEKRKFLVDLRYELDELQRARYPTVCDYWRPVPQELKLFASCYVPIGQGLSRYLNSHVILEERWMPALDITFPSINIPGLCAFLNARDLANVLAVKQSLAQQPSLKYLQAVKFRSEMEADLETLKKDIHEINFDREELHEQLSEEMNKSIHFLNSCQVSHDDYGPESMRHAINLTFLTAMESLVDSLAANCDGISLPPALFLGRLDPHKFQHWKGILKLLLDPTSTGIVGSNTTEKYNIYTKMLQLTLSSQHPEIGYRLMEQIFPEGITVLKSSFNRYEIVYEELFCRTGQMQWLLSQVRNPKERCAVMFTWAQRYNSHFKERLLFLIHNIDLAIQNGQLQEIEFFSCNAVLQSFKTTGAAETLSILMDVAAGLEDIGDIPKRRHIIDLMIIPGLKALIEEDYLNDEERARYQNALIALEAVSKSLAS